jgi:hypothetical protein
LKEVSQNWNFRQPFTGCVEWAGQPRFVQSDANCGGPYPCSIWLR